MIIGSNPRKEARCSMPASASAAQGRVAGRRDGENADLTYPYNYLGAGTETLAGFATHPPASKQKPMLLLGQGALTGDDGEAVLAQAFLAAQALGCLKDGWTGLAVLHTAAARVGGLDLGFVPGEGGLDAQAMAGAGALDVVFLLGADEIDTAPGAFVVYQGTHGDKGAHRADVILPGATYTEKSGTYVNTEGRVQMADRANFPPGQAKEDWAVLRALSEVVGHKLPFDSLGGLRKALYAAHPHFAGIDQIAPAAFNADALAAAAAPLAKRVFAAAVTDFYLTNPIARASSVMAECSALALQRAAAPALQAAE